jgi:nicotinamide-nucleotide amidase
MRVEMVSVGNELLDGRVTDGNATSLARVLGAYGVPLSRVTVVPDRIDAIGAAIASAADAGAELCVLSGGLGPTEDDLTAEALAAACGVSMAPSDEVDARVRARLAHLGIPPGPGHDRMIRRPLGADVLDNPNGTAPGIGIRRGGMQLFSFPGPKHEFRALAEAAVGAWIGDRAAVQEVRSLSVFGLVEAQIMKRLEGALPDVEVGYRATLPEVHLSFRAATAEGPASAAEIARERLGDVVYRDGIGGLPEVAARLLAERDRTLSVIDGGLGGLLGVDLIEHLEDPGRVTARFDAALADPEAVALDGLALAIGPLSPGRPSEARVVLQDGAVRHAARVRLPLDPSSNRRVVGHVALDMLRRHLTGREVVAEWFGMRLG